MKQLALNIIVITMILSCTTLMFACSDSTNEQSLDIPSQISDTPHFEKTEEAIPEVDVDDNAQTSIEKVQENTQGDTTPTQAESATNDTITTISYAYYLSSTTDNLNIRSKANSTSTKLGTINKGDMLSYVDKEGDWYKTIYKEKTAYVSAKYIKIVKLQKTSDDIEKVIDVGLTLLGHPYVYGSERYHWGNGKLNTNFVKGEYDCSALMQYMFYMGSGDLLEVTSKKQYYQGSKVDTLKRGDLMFFTNANGYNATGINRVRHVGIYLGDNYILHTASDYAVIEPISDTRWSYFITAKRIIA